MQLSRIAAIAMAAVLLSAFWSGAAQAQAPDAAAEARGGALFASMGCAACHGAPGGGGTPRGADLALSALAQGQDGGERLYRFMGDMTRGHPDLNGRPRDGMRAIPPVSQAEAADLLAAIRAGGGKARGDRGRAEAPAVVAASGTPCRIIDALYVLTSIDKKARTRADAYEVACDGGLGRVVIKTVAAGKASYQVRDCIATSTPGPDGKPSQLACTLPANGDPLAQLAPYLAAAGLTCAPAQVRAMGSTADAAYIEVACASGRGYVVGLPPTLDPAKAATAVNCLARAPGAATECRLVSRDAMLASLTKPLISNADAACQVKARRYVASNRGDEYYEAACASGMGFMVVADATGAYKSRIDCANAEGIAGGCILTDMRAAQSADSPRYAGLAKAAGYDCAVSGYRILASTAQEETVEMACANRPDGAMAQLPRAGAARIFNCAAAETTGYRCLLTREDAAFAQLTAAVKKAHPTSTCLVSASKFLGVNPDGGFVEVACADREPGYVLQYAKATAAPAAVLYCSQLSARMGVTCRLAGNITGAP